MLYNCYWGTTTIYEDYYSQDFPNVMNYKKDDGTWVLYDVYSQIAMNFIFNLGFMAMDWIYLLIMWSNVDSYWYRVGFVGGDIYMRFFYRTLYNVPIR